MKKTLIALTSSTLIMAACGGGGGGGESAPASQNNELKATAQFDAGNIVPNTKAIAETTVAGFTAIDLTAQGLNIAATVSSASASSVSAKRQGLMLTSSKSCTNGGTIDVSLEDNDSSNGISSGDVATLTANNCQVSPSDSLNGKIVASLQTYSNSENYSGTLTFTNLRVIEDDYDYTVSGEASASTQVDNTAETSSETVTYKNFSFTNNKSNKTGKIISGSTKSLFSTTSSPTADEYFEFNNLFAEIPELNGIVKIYTEPRWSGKANEDNWSAGVLIFEGANNSSIKLDAGFGTNAQARLTLTLNGSTIAQTVNWEDLD